MSLSDAERQYITRGAELNVRCDGRNQHDFRRKEIQLGVIAQATGSSRVRIGGTDVIVAIKADIGPPLEDQPNHGRLVFSVECSPVANPAFRGRGGDELSSEITKSLERMMFASSSSTKAAIQHQPLDLSQLSIISGKSCWILYIDALLLDIDGSYIDTVSVAFKAALFDAKIPKIELIQGQNLEGEPEYEVDDDPECCVSIDTSKIPIYLRICRIGDASIVDPSGNEEECSSAMIDVAVNRQGKICALTKRKEQGIDAHVLLEMMYVAQQLGQRVHDTLDVFFSKT